MKNEKRKKKKEKWKKKKEKWKKKKEKRKKKKEKLKKNNTNDEKFIWKNIAKIIFYQTSLKISFHGKSMEALEFRFIG